MNDLEAWARQFPPASREMLKVSFGLVTDTQTVPGLTTQVLRNLTRDDLEAVALNLASTLAMLVPPATAAAYKKALSDVVDEDRRLAAIDPEHTDKENTND